MKVGILTYHREINDGSVLQAYCLEQLLRSQFPKAQVELIDYRPLRGEKATYRRFVSRKYPFIQFDRIKKTISLRNFLREFCTISSQSCTTDNIEKASIFVNKQGYDAIFVGSDTIWEGRKSEIAPPAPNLFYLPRFIINVKKIAFAASADPIYPKFVYTKERANQIFQAINGFDFISVRDDATKKFLVNLGLTPERIHFMPDPTLLWDFRKLVNSQKLSMKLDKPLAAITIGKGDRRVVRPLSEQLQKEGYDVITDISGRVSSYAINSVSQRLAFHREIDLLVTDRFHGSIFTLKLARAPVLFIEVASKWPDKNSKVRDLFKRLNIEYMVWRDDGQSNIPDDLICTSLSKWADSESKIATNLNSLKKGGENKLNQISDHLGF